MDGSCYINFNLLNRFDNLISLSVLRSTPISKFDLQNFYNCFGMRRKKLKMIRIDCNNLISPFVNVHSVSIVLSFLEILEVIADNVFQLFSLLNVLASRDSIMLKNFKIKLNCREYFLGFSHNRNFWTDEIILQSLCKIEVVYLDVFSLPTDFEILLFQLIISNNVELKHLSIKKIAPNPYYDENFIILQGLAAIKLKSYATTTDGTQAVAILDTIYNAKELTLESLELSVVASRFDYPEEKVSVINNKLKNFDFGRDVKVIGWFLC